MSWRHPKYKENGVNTPNETVCLDCGNNAGYHTGPRATYCPPTQAGFPKQPTFWLVWSPSGNSSPTVRHADEDAALTEAIRLAQLYPGREFYTVQAASLLVSGSIVRTDLR